MGKPGSASPLVPASPAGRSGHGLAYGSPSKLGAVRLHDLPTPSLIIDADAFEHNVATMAEAHPGPRLRPRVKAFKSTAMARRLAGAGHRTFCCATPREMEGMAAAGLGEDLLLANEVVDPRRLSAMVAATGDARVTVAVDSEATVAVAANAGVREVLVDVDVGLPRCGCQPDDAGRVADAARAAGMGVRGVMGYEGHVMVVDDREKREHMVAGCMAKLVAAHDAVGGEVISACGTGTYDINTWANEIQAGSYALMDTAYAKLDLPFRQALELWTEVISVSTGGWAVCNGGLKSLGMDHGDPAIVGADVLFCSDEHITFVPGAAAAVAVGDRVRVVPAHVDPTVAKHERLHLVQGDDVVEVWEVDLRHW
ncbi:DSD1 family PLP-dependent enzyme [soil metagenome]